MSQSGTSTMNAPFHQLPACEKLKKFAKSSPNLTEEKVLSPERVRNFSSFSAGLKLNYAFEKVNEEILQSLFDLSDQTRALEKVSQMQNGEIVNFIEGHECEHRPVLHTATRDLFDTPLKGERAQEARKLSELEHEKLQKFLKKVEGKFEHLILVGIGGSDLGPRSAYFALEHYCQPGRQVHFISNVDPDDLAQTLKGVELKKSLAVVVSKSGNTLETLTNERFLRREFEKAGCQCKDHFVAVTGKGSPMDDPKKYLESFYMWDFVGGRYSTTSMVGGVMLSWACGYEVFLDYLKGCHEMDQVALTKKGTENLPLLGALLGIWNRNFLGYPTVGVIPYSQALWRLPAHLQQLDMESNGKRVDKFGHICEFHTGPVVWGEAGTNGQHSFFQLFHQGTDVVPLEFIAFKESQKGMDFELEKTNSQEKLLSNVFAQAIALAKGERSENPNRFFPGNRPSRLLIARQLTPKTLGALWSYFENKVAFQGFIWNINSFDQEGVQLGKVLATKLMKGFAKERGQECKESFPLGDALRKELSDL